MINLHGVCVMRHCNVSNCNCCMCVRDGSTIERCLGRQLCAVVCVQGGSTMEQSLGRQLVDVVLWVRDGSVLMLNLERQCVVCVVIRTLQLRKLVQLCRHFCEWGDGFILERSLKLCTL